MTFYAKTSSQNPVQRKKKIKDLYAIPPAEGLINTYISLDYMILSPWKKQEVEDPTILNDVSKEAAREGSLLKEAWKLYAPFGWRS